MHKSIVYSLLWLLFEFLGICLFVHAFNWVFHNPYCDIIFQCGCTFNWAGGWDNCNVHSLDPLQAKCPWCDCPPWVAVYTQYIVKLFMILIYYIVVYGIKTRKKSRKITRFSRISYKFNMKNILKSCLGLMITPISFLIASTSIAFIFFLTSDYPIFLFYHR